MEENNEHTEKEKRTCGFVAPALNGRWSSRPTRYGIRLDLAAAASQPARTAPATSSQASSPLSPSLRRPGQPRSLLRRRTPQIYEEDMAPPGLQRLPLPSPCTPSSSPGRPTGESPRLDLLARAPPPPSPFQPSARDTWLGERDDVATGDGPMEERKDSAVFAGTGSLLQRSGDRGGTGCGLFFAKSFRQRIPKRDTGMGCRWS
jgi:hypothetical protein